MEKNDAMFKPDSIEGVRVIKAITDNERYATWQIDRDGVDYFLKFAKSVKTKERLINEAWGNRAMDNLSALDAAPFRVPELTDSNPTDGWLITQFVAGEPLTPGDYPRQQVLAAEDILLGIYVFMDQHRQPVLPASEADFGFSQTASEFEEKIADKLKDIPDAVKIVGEGLVAESVRFCSDNFVSLEATFAHGDLTPKHVVAQTDGMPFVFDYESCSNRWPRFYELLNYATKLDVVYGLSDEANQFSRRFFESINEDARQHDTELKVVSAIRALLLAHELAMKPTNQRIYDTELKNWHLDQVRNLLSRCVVDKPLL